MLGTKGYFLAYTYNLDTAIFALASDTMICLSQCGMFVY